MREREYLFLRRKHKQSTRPDYKSIPFSVDRHSENMLASGILRACILVKDFYPDESLTCYVSWIFPLFCDLDFSELLLRCTSKKNERKKTSHVYGVMTVISSEL